MMKMCKRLFVIALVSVLLTMCLMACGGNQNDGKVRSDKEKIVGRWCDTVNESEMEFFSDGTGTMKSLTDNTSYTISSWLLEDGRMKLTCSSLVGDITVVGSYEFTSDDAFTYTSDKDNEVTVYERQ